ncbi:hypothetical protein [Mycobacterium tuberculosis]|uniref:hypothetical protein n=1 Tax=Mycobacterium tuberculosis TaxID=1773 RepID=UPI00272A71E1|nr:hypothetical protein [Mycobacterium tuberculosis]
MGTLNAASHLPRLWSKRGSLGSDAKFIAKAYPIVLAVKAAWFVGALRGLIFADAHPPASQITPSGGSLKVWW